MIAAPLLRQDSGPQHPLTPSELVAVLHVGIVGGSLSLDRLSCLRFPADGRVRAVWRDGSMTIYSVEYAS